MYIAKDGTLSQTGIDYGKAPVLKWHNDKRAIVLWPGHTSWVCRGSSAHWPAHWWLLEVEFLSESVFVAKRTIKEAVPGRRWMACYKALLAEAKGA